VKRFCGFCTRRERALLEEKREGAGVEESAKEAAEAECTNAATAGGGASKNSGSARRDWVPGVAFERSFLDRGDTIVLCAAAA
jgi:hypothetical protein